MLIGSLGLGLFILVIVWILALILFVFGIKFQNNIAWISLGLASAFTIILLVIPVESPQKIREESDELEKDYAFIHKVALLSFLLLSALLSVICFFIFHCIEAVRPKASKVFENEHLKLYFIENYS